MTDKPDQNHNAHVFRLANDEQFAQQPAPETGRQTFDDVTAVIVTRGNVDLNPVYMALAPYFKATQLVTWNNRCADCDLGPFGQFYAAHFYARTPLVYFQDDDVRATALPELLASWERGKVVCNMPQAHQDNYAAAPDRLMGFGSIFEWSMIRPTFAHYVKHFPVDKILLREPGRLFTCLNPWKVVNVGHEDMDYARDPDRLYRQPDHGSARDEMRSRAAMLMLGGGR